MTDLIVHCRLLQFCIIDLNLYFTANCTDNREQIELKYK